MPEVPRYVQTERPQGYLSGVTIDTGGARAVSDALGRLGQAMQGAGRTALSVAADMQDRQNKAVVQEAQTAYEQLRQVYWHSVEQDQVGKKALGDNETDSVMAASSKWHAQTVASLMEDKNDAQKRMLTEYFDKRGLSLDEQAFNWQTKQQAVYEDSAADAFRKSQIDRAIANPGDLETCMANYATSILSTNRGKGLDDLVSEQQIQAGWDSTVTGIVRSSLASGDVQGAQAALDRSRKDLSETAAAALGKSISDRREVLAAKWEAQKARAEKEAEQARMDGACAEVQSLMNELPADMADEERQAKLVFLTKDLDPKTRQAVRQMVGACEKERRLQRDAQVVQELAAWDRGLRTSEGAGGAAGGSGGENGGAGRRLSLLEQRQKIESSDYLPETKDRLLKAIQDHIEGKDNTAASAMLARQVRMEIDAGQLEPGAVASRCLALGMNSRDTQAVMQYQGRAATYSQYRIDGLVETVLGRDVDQAVKCDVFRLLQRDPDIAAGRALSDQQLKEKIYSLYRNGVISSGNGLSGRNRERHGAISADRAGQFRPDLTDEQSAGAAGTSAASFERGVRA